LNWDSFKWRNYDPAMARFMSIDPLTEEYTDWSPYVFSGNRVIDARELEGLEPYRLFDTEEEAALNWGEQYNGRSIHASREYGSTIGTRKIKGKIKYSYGPPKISKSSHSVTPSSAPKGTTASADIHSHGSYEIKYGTGNDQFSDTDMKDNKKTGLTGYLTAPNGTLQIFIPNGNAIFTINSDLENDPRDPTSPRPTITPITPLIPSPIVPSPVPSPVPGGMPTYTPTPSPPTPSPPILPVHFPNTPKL
jgi:hypothetical protein